jgi:SPP1 gp7 family putative phage head morphogenesis protein
MTLGVHQVDGRLAAKAAIKIRAALAQSVDAKKVINDYLMTHPVRTDNFAQDRARARAWAIHNVQIDNTALHAALRKHYADMYVTGVASTYAAWGVILRNKKAQKEPPHNWNPDAFALSALKEVPNWDMWNPGSAAKEALVRPPGGLEKLLNGIKINSLNTDKSSYDLLGTQLADGFAIGASPTQLAKMIKDSISSPARALTVAITEGARAANAATMDSYKALGVEQVEWINADPCDECDPDGDINGQVRNLGEEFSNGYAADDLPIHPNCRCNTAPAEVDWSTFDYAGSLDAALNADG